MRGPLSGSFLPPGPPFLGPPDYLPLPLPLPPPPHLFPPFEGPGPELGPDEGPDPDPEG